MRSDGDTARRGANPSVGGFYETVFMIYSLIALDLEPWRCALTNLCRSITHMCLYTQENFDTNSVIP